MASSAPPTMSPIKNPRKPLGFFANAVKLKHSFIQLLAATGLFMLSLRSLGQHYRIENIHQDTDALKEEPEKLETRIINIKQSLLAEAAADFSGAFAARLRVLFGDDKI